jgi:hypothetical protein
MQTSQAICAETLPEPQRSLRRDEAQTVDPIERLKKIFASFRATTAGAQAITTNQSGFFYLIPDLCV